MRTRVFLLAVSCAVLGGCAARSTNDGAPPIAQRFQFAWPDGATARLSYRTDQRSGTGGSVTGTRIHALTVSVTDAGTRVVGGTPGSADPFGDSGRNTIFARGWLRDHVRGVSADLPTVMLSSAGKVLTVEGTAEILQQRDLALAGAVLPEAERARLRRVYDEQFLRSIARDLWEALVGMWVGQPARPGSRLELRHPLAIPELGLAIDAHVSARVGQKVPCESGAPGTCLEVTGLWLLDPNELVSVLRERDAPLARGEVRQELSGVLHRETLQPEWVEIRRQTALTWASGDASIEDWTRRWSFAWSPSAEARGPAQHRRDGSCSVARPNGRPVPPVRRSSAPSHERAK